MKLVRSVAYAVIVICALLCIVIFIYANKKNTGEEGNSASHVSLSDSGSDSGAGSYEGSTPPNIADLIGDKIGNGNSGSSKTSISGNDTGEISYDEIVRRQNEDLDREFRNVISDYNKKYGIETKTPTSTSTTATKNYKYFVNKATKIIHRSDCLLKPVNSSDMLNFDSISEAEKKGYTERCPVCSP